MKLSPGDSWIRSTLGSELLGDVLVVLLLLAFGVLIYRVLRQRHLLLTLLGWSAYALYTILSRATSIVPDAHPVLLALSSVCLTASVGFLMASALKFTRNRRWLWPASLAVLSLAGAQWVQGLLAPENQALALAAQVLLVAVAAFGAGVVVVFNRGRRDISPWFFALLLISVSIEGVVPGGDYRIAVRVLTLLLFSVGLLLVILEDTRMRRGQVAVVNAISAAISQARDHGDVIPAVLEALRAATGSSAAWFRHIQNDEAVLTHSVALSDHFKLVRCTLDLKSGYGFLVRQLSRPAVLRTEKAEPVTRGDLQQEGLEQVLVIPVHGKNSMLGVIGLGSGAVRGYTSEEMHFFTEAASDLGVGIERLKLLQAVMRSQRDWVSVIDSLDDMVLVHDQEFRLIKLNRVMQHRVGRPYHALVEQPCGEVLPRALGARWERCPYCEAGSQPGQVTDPCFGGKTLVSTSSYEEPSAGIQATVHVIHDATDRYASEERYRRLFDQVQEGVFTSTPNGRILDCNDAFARMLGYEQREELYRLDIARDLYAAPWQRERFCHEIAGANYLRNYEVVLRRRDRSLLTALESSFAVRGRDGEIEAYQGFIIDVSEKKHAEEEIRRRNRELQAVNAVAIIATQSFDLDEVVTGALAQAVDLFSADAAAIFLYEPNTSTLQRRASYGYRSEQARQIQIEVPELFLHRLQEGGNEILTRRDLSDVPPHLVQLIQSESVNSFLWAVMRTRENIVGALLIGWRNEREIGATDESLLLAISRQLATSLEKIRLYNETRRAYEDLRQTQEQLLQSEKMSAVGQLVSGVAHELNNPLTAILGYAQLLDSEGLNERCHDYVSKLERQAQRSQRLVQNLLSFARRRKPSKELVDARRIVEDTLALRDYDFRLSKIAVEREFESNVPGVVADAHQLEQVFLNIINNAVDAILEASPEGKLWVRVGSDGDDRVLVEFRDNGPGLNEPSRVFDPFYTTKPLGKGTGLGLSICYGILKEHGGQILASNHPEGGACFQIVLPAAAVKVKGSPKNEEPTINALANCRILVIENEEAVLEATRRILISSGAQVTAFSDPAQALAEVQKRRFDAILVDCSTPTGWSAPDIYYWLKEHRSGLERFLIFCASPEQEGTIEKFSKEHQVSRLTKPFSPKQLVDSIRIQMESLRTVSLPSGR